MQSTPRVGIPTSKNNEWISKRSTVTINNVKYNVQKLTTQPISSESSLTTSDSKTVKFSNSWAAGITNALKVIVGAAVGAISTGASYIATVYDVLTELVSGIKKTTKITTPHIVYSWAATSTAVFTFVRKDSQNDSHQWFAQVSTKTATSYKFPKFNYTNSNGSSKLTPSIVQGKRSFTSTPKGYGNEEDAVKHYLGGASGAQRRQVGTITISGPESKSVQSFSAPSANFIAHVN